MKPRFSFSTSNIVYFAVVALVFVVAFFASFDGASLPPAAISYRIGYIVGQVLGLLLLCTLFAWIVWRLSRRSKRAASVTFNVFLTLIVLTALSEKSQFDQIDKAPNFGATSALCRIVDFPQEISLVKRSPLKITGHKIRSLNRLQLEFP